MIATQHKINYGAWLIGGSGLLGLIVSLFNYYLLSSPIRHTGGAALMVATTLMIAIFGFMIPIFSHIHARWERAVLYIIVLLLILGSLFAAFLLEGLSLFIILCFGLLGWGIQFFTR